MAQGTLTTAGQHDWLKVSLIANQAYLFTIIGLDAESTVGFGPAGTLSGGIDDSVLGSVSPFTGTAGTLEAFVEPATSGTYFIDVSSHDPATYDVSGTRVSVDYSNNSSTIGTVAINGPATSGTLATLDQSDWLALSLVANQGYVFTISGLSQYISALVGPAGDLTTGGLSYAESVSPFSDSPPTQQVFYEPDTTGTYYLDISDSTGPTGYSVSGQTVSVDYTDNASTTGTVVLGGAATVGTLATAGQHDWLKLSLIADQAYLFTVTGLDLNAQLEIGAAGTNGLDDSVQAAATPGSSGGGPQVNEIWYEPATTGTYFLDISDSSNTAQYSVIGTQVTSTYSDNVTTAGTIAIGATLTGQVLQGEHDWLRLSLVKNQGYLISVSGLNQSTQVELGPANELGDSLLSELVPGSTLAASSTDALFYEPTATGTYYLDLANSEIGSTDHYAITATAVATDYADNDSTTGSVTIGGPATTGTLSTIDQHDWLRLSLTANQAYLFTVTGLDAAALLLVGPEGQLDDSLATGTPVPTTTGNLTGSRTSSEATNQVWYEPATTGTYYLDISDRTNIASYSVTGAAIPSDYPDNTSTTAVVVACFAEGTKIATLRGEVAVETLCIGDAVQTATGDRAAITWLGHRQIACAQHPDPASVWPVRISRHAFAPGQPARDLFLSPDHAIFAEGVLIPVKYLINGTSICQVACSDITYWHVELERHDVLLAEGLACESYLDTGNRTVFANGGVTRLHPHFGPALDAAIWETRACAPLRIDGEAVVRVIARLNQSEPCSTAPLQATADLAKLLQPDWYLATYPDVAVFGIDPVVHYTHWGRAEGRLPCPPIDLIRALGLVDHGMVVFSMADVVAVGVDPVAHFVESGWRERRDPNPYFDTDWYLAAHPVPDGMNPLLHYVLFGEAAGSPPGPHFDPAWYRLHYGLDATTSPLAHYLAHRHTQRFSPLASFDVERYVQANDPRFGRDPYAHFLAAA